MLQRQTCCSISAKSSHDDKEIKKCIQEIEIPRFVKKAFYVYCLWFLLEKHLIYLFMAVLDLVYDKKMNIRDFVLRVEVSTVNLPTNERYVLITALCCSPPVAAAPLKLGQYNQRNTVPIEFVKKEIVIKERQSTLKIKTLKHVSVTLHQPYITKAHVRHTGT
jgi:hypothetical protein